MVRFLSRGAGVHFLLAGILLAIFAATWFVGVVPTRLHPFDVVFFADVAWRTFSGLRPHIDYYCPWGAAVPMLLGAGHWLAGGTIDGVGYINACVSFAVGLWAYLLLLRRVSLPLVAAAGAILLALLCAAPTSLGYPFAVTGQAMFYNRYCFAFLGLLLIEAFPISSLNSRLSLAGAFSTGLICAILFFIKGSFFLVAVVFALASFVWNGSFSLRRLLSIAAGFLAGALPFLIYLNFRLDLVLSDLSSTASSRSGALKLSTIRALFTQDITYWFILLALAFLLGWLQQSTSRLQRARFLILAVVIYATDVMLMATNAQPYRVPLTD
jgi:hypothetical protein